MTAPQWQALRHVHISTLFTFDSSAYPVDTYWPPEVIPNWETCCEKLGEIGNLQSLRLDIFVHVKPRHMDFILAEILVPLKSINVIIFEVELNCEPSPKAWLDIGKVPFTLIMRTRDLNVQLFGTDGHLDN